MARFLLACYPISGHLHPNLALAHALRERGHEVGIYSGAAARLTIEGEGFTFFPYNPEMDAHLIRILAPEEGPSDAARLTVNRAIWSRIAHVNATLSDWLLSTVPHQVADLQTAVSQWQPHALTTDITLVGPVLVLQETQQIPVAVFDVLPACPIPGPHAPTWGRGLPPPRTWYTRLQSKLEQVVQDWMLRQFRQEINRLRARYHLQPLTVSLRAFMGQAPLYLVTGTPELDYNRNDLPASVHYVGPCLWHRPSAEPPPSWLLDLPTDRPVVHVTEGTIHVAKPLVLRAAAQGLGGLDIEVIMTTGKHRKPEDLDLGPLAVNIRVEQFVPHGDLFPQTDVVVTTGGAGTVLTALTAGVPLVVVPTSWDLPENAQRIVEAGVGLRIQPQDCTPDNMRKAVETILSDFRYRRNAQAIGAALQRQGGPSRAAELLEALASRTPGQQPNVTAQQIPMPNLSVS